MKIMMDVKYEAGRQLKLYVTDTGRLDTFAVYVDGQWFDEVADQSPHAWPIPRPAVDLPILVAFGGVDGGISAIYDVTDPASKIKLARQEGTVHAYRLRV